MVKGLEEAERLAYENACCRCQYYIDKKCTNKGECVWKTIKEELKDYQEIKEIAKRYNWDDIISEIFNVKADEKYRDLFSSAIVNIQEDYRKARVLDIIYNSPFIIDDLVELGKLPPEAKKRYLFGTITNADVEKVEEFFKDGEK